MYIDVEILIELQHALEDPLLFFYRLSGYLIIVFQFKFVFLFITLIVATEGIDHTGVIENLLLKFVFHEGVILLKIIDRPIQKINLVCFGYFKIIPNLIGDIALRN